LEWDNEGNVLYEEDKTFYIHKYEVGQCYGGPEEGGWWYEAGTPTEDWKPLGPIKGEEIAYVIVRALNEYEHERAERDEQYSYTSVLSHQSEHFSYDIDESPVAEGYPKVRPHYE